MSMLIFQIQAPLSSWGITAVGEYRPSYDYPGVSALSGLLAAALGLRRDEEDGHAMLRDGYGYAVGVQNSGRLLRDYHTAQAPSQAKLNKRPHASRRDELALPKHELNTVLSTRDYRQGAGCLVAVQARADSRYSLNELSAALRCPRFVLYFGRKACPPAAPLHPQVIKAVTAHRAFEEYRAQLNNAIGQHRDRYGMVTLESCASIEKIAWSDGIDVGLSADLTLTRKDFPLSRKGWQFGDRIEHVALIRAEASTCTST